MDPFTHHLDLSPLKGRRRGLIFCPFHSHHHDTPSLSVNLDKQLFHCFTCKAEGGAERLLQLLLERCGIDGRALARQQPWAHEPTRALNEVQTRIREARRWISDVRAHATDTPESWALLAAAARLENTLGTAEETTDAAMGW
jgi:hypothetical protein